MSVRNNRGLDVEQLRFFEVILAVRRRRGENITVNELINEYCQQLSINRHSRRYGLDDIERILSRDKPK